MDSWNTAIFEEKKNIYEKILAEKRSFNVPERKNNSLIISY